MSDRPGQPELVDAFVAADAATARLALERRRQSLFRGHPLLPARDLAHRDGVAVVQELQFAIDCLPALHRVLRSYPRERTVRLLDFGPGNGAGAQLVASLYRSGFLWCPVEVDALDHVELRRPLSELDHPLVRYRVGSLDSLAPGEVWDVVYCSNVLEHLAEPGPLLDALVRRARCHVVVYAPFAERPPLSLGHKTSITEELFAPHGPIELSVIDSPAWQPYEGARQLLAVLPGRA